MLVHADRLQGSLALSPACDCPIFVDTDDVTGSFCAHAKILIEAGDSFGGGHSLLGT